MEEMGVKNSLSESYVDSSNHMIAKPKPRKPGDSTSYANSAQASPLNSIVPNHVTSNSRNSVGANHQSTSNASAVSNTNTNDGTNILMRTFGNLAANSGVSVNGQALLNAVTSSSKSATVHVANFNDTDAQSPSKASPQKPVYDHKKLGVLSQFVKSETSTTTVQITVEENRSALTLTPNGKNANSKLQLNKC